MIRILDWYIIRKFLGSFLFMLGAFMMIFVVIDVTEKMEDILEFHPPIDLLITQYYRDFIISYGNLLSPICVFLSVIFFTSQLTQRTEVVAILSSGTSFYRLMAPYMAVAILISGISFYLNAYAVPLATDRRTDFEYNYLKDRNFNYAQGSKHLKIAPDTYLYILNWNMRTYEGFGFFMEKMEAGDIVWRMEAQRIVSGDSANRWLLYSVTERSIRGLEEHIRLRPLIDTTLTLTPGDLFIKTMHAESIPLDVLDEQIRIERERGLETVEELVKEKYERFAYPFAAIILTMIGFALSTRKARGGTPFQIGLGLAFSFAYIILLVAGQNILGGFMPLWLSVWMPNIAFAALGIFLLRIAPK